MIQPLMFNDWVEEKREEAELEAKLETELEPELGVEPKAQPIPTAEGIEKYAIKYNATYAGNEGFVICKDYTYDKYSNTIVFTATQLIAYGIIPDESKEIRFDDYITNC